MPVKNQSEFDSKGGIEIIPPKNELNDPPKMVHRSTDRVEIVYSSKGVHLFPVKNW